MIHNVKNVVQRKKLLVMYFLNALHPFKYGHSQKSLGSPDNFPSLTVYANMNYLFCRIALHIVDHYFA